MLLEVKMDKTKRIKHENCQKNRKKTKQKQNKTKKDNLTKVIVG